MPRFCAIFGCSNRSSRETNKKYFSFPGVRDRRGRDLPEGRERRALWIKAIRRADLTPEKIKNSTVCSDHFLTGAPAAPGDLRNPDYVPSQKMGYALGIPLTLEATHRHSRAKKRLAEVTVQEIPPPNTENDVEEQIVCEVPETTEKILLSHDTQTENVEDILLHQELYKLREFKERSCFEQKTFINDDKKTLYFSGIPSYSALNCIFTKLIEPHIKITPQNKIQVKFTHFLITLIKLRLNVDFTLLAYICNVSVQTISRTFYTTLNIMYYRLKNFIFWPTRQQLIETMPRCFKDAFGNKVTVIIDCFEVRIEKSKNLEAQTSTWSSYKHNNTVKILIGITPQGTISFISQAYGGRISDKALTEDCGILDRLNPGDVVLADRGFLIEEEVGLHMATVITPAFLKGKKQLDLKDVESTRRLASVRIHVERVIGVVRQKYTILYDVIPMFLAKKRIQDLAVVDQILVVCSALVNLCPTIVNNDS